MSKSVMFKSSLYLLTLFVGAVASSAAVAGDASSGFVQVDDSKNVSQLIRSNSNHYWNYMKKTADLSGLRKYMSFEGMSAGDPHLGNFAVMPVTKLNGDRSFAYLDIDFDDMGQAPLVLDFTRLMVALKAVSKDIKAEEMVQAYITGLQGQPMAAPTEIATGLATDVNAYEAQVNKYVAKRVIDDHFNAEAAEVQIYSGNIKAADLQNLFPGKTILDISQKTKDRGGSQDSLRLWILVGSADGSKRIYELKQWDRPGTSFFEKQAAPMDWAQAVYKTFRAGVNADDYKLVDLGSNGLFWLRQKKVSIVKVDYNGKTPDDKDFAHRLGVYDCWYLGQIHGGQLGGDQYLKAIQKDPAKFKEAVKAVAKDYLEKALEALKSGG